MRDNQDSPTLALHCYICGGVIDDTPLSAKPSEATDYSGVLEPGFALNLRMDGLYHHRNIYTCVRELRLIVRAYAFAETPQLLGRALGGDSIQNRMAHMLLHLQREDHEQ